MRKMTVGFYIKDESEFEKISKDMFDRLKHSDKQEGWGVHFVSHFDESKRLEDIERLVEELDGYELKEELRRCFASDPDKYSVEASLE